MELLFNNLIMFYHDFILSTIIYINYVSMNGTIRTVCKPQRQSIVIYFLCEI